MCHCFHVEQLMADVATVKTDVQALKDNMEIVRVGGGLGTSLGGRPPAPPEPLPLGVGPLQ